MADAKKSATKVWIRKGPLRERWGDMPYSTFHDRLTRGLIPKPEFPFGKDTPYWRVSVIEEFEARSQKAAA